MDNLGEAEGLTPAVMPTPMTPYGDAGTPSMMPQKTQYQAINVKIWFRCVKPIYGIRFVNTTTNPKSFPHAYTINHPVPCSTSFWLPCLDGIWERCTWEFHISIPRTIGDILRRTSSTDRCTNGHTQSASRSSSDDVLDVLEDSRSSIEMSVICSADSYEEAIHPDDPSRKIVSFAQGSPAGASHMGFLVGPFERCNLTDFRETAEDEHMGSSAVEVLG